MPPVTNTDEMLKLYRSFRKLWVLQGDMMHPDDVRMAQEKLVKLSDELAEYEN